MSEIEQKRLYKHYKKLAINGVTNIQRENAGKYAAEILSSFPQFKVKEVKKTDSKETKEKK